MADFTRTQVCEGLEAFLVNGEVKAFGGWSPLIIEVLRLLPGWQALGSPTAKVDFWACAPGSRPDDFGHRCDDDRDNGWGDEAFTEWQEFEGADEIDASGFNDEVPEEKSQAIRDFISAAAMRQEMGAVL